MAFLAEAKTSEQVADVLQRVVTLHNKRMSILGWREVWKGIASTDHGKGTPHLPDERRVCRQSALDMHGNLQLQAYTLYYWHRAVWQLIKAKVHCRRCEQLHWETSDMILSSRRHICRA